MRLLVSFHRRAILACLSIVLGAATVRAHAAEQANSISNLAVTRGTDGRWSTHFDYFFNGEPPRATFEIRATRKSGDPADPTELLGSSVYRPETGSHHIAAPISARESTTARVVVSLREVSSQTILLRQEILAEIDGPSDARSTTNPAQARNEQDLDQAIALIDDAFSSDGLRRPREILEQVIARDARFDPAYVELARVAMKTNWGPEGLHQAELLLDSALKIRPDSVDAKILMGYVYANQLRYPAAQVLFADAARSNPPNLWLWANWGESLAMQGKADEAITRYREAVTRPVTEPRYARARLDAYQNLLKLLAARNDVDGMEALYEQHARDHTREYCVTADYARFMLAVRGNARRAIEIARDGQDLSCGGAPSTRQITGLAQYLIWAEGKADDNLDALNQARIYLPAGARTFYLLANSDRTMPAARKLIGMGESIDQKDNDRMTALGQALSGHDSDTAARLLSLGAKPETPVGTEDLPVALLPVFEGDLNAIRTLRRAGVDYSKIRYGAATALDFARQSGNEPLLQALSGKLPGL